MKEISIFDVIGPNMIGPSSSHTAGALRIALMVYKLVEKPIKEVNFVLYGSFAKTYRGHGTDKALVAGILGMDTEDERIKDAFKYAEEAGLHFTFETVDSHAEVHPNTVEIIAKDTSGEVTTIMGASIGGGNIRIDKINGVEVEFTGEYTTLIIKQQDTPGIVAHITQVLTSYNINIAFMRLYREEKGSFAYTLIELDESVDSKVIEKMKEHPHIISVQTIKGI
ncbi:MAG: L-serine ammonia-lyase, iron-sulfur-dependent subunit beta [Cellulosilyticaceae bacterium]